ncbi:MAG: ammonium transporter, Amt family [Thermoleophilaceae bacterium]|jgi:Amt family ammonium transporter|nr:ammonium transporter, Amt family [Thermoleophilaceae bacterium]MEA2402010.1 ammonium transporter, Amt family [Thermoleophilaceae bacterium]
MRRTAVAACVSLGVLLMAPAAALAADGPTLEDTVSAVNTTWVIVAGVLVMFMQAGFLFLEVGFSRAKNAGLGVVKILTNFSIAAIAYWATGFALAFGGAGTIAGTNGWFLDVGHTASEAASDIPLLGVVGISPAALLFFQFVFCAVSLAIVWGTTIERIKFSAYVIYAVIFSALIYPVLSHWIFGGGWLQVNVGMQDFAGSTVVHLIGATGGLAALLLLGPRRGKYGPDGKPRAIPGHSMPLVGLGVLILWLGWFGFNPGSTLSAIGGRFAEVVLVTNLAAAAGVIAALSVMYRRTKTYDVGMAGNGAIAALVAITAPSGYVEFWAAPIIGAVAGVIVVYGVILIEKVLDDPVGALSAHGLAGVWGTLSCGIFTSPRLAELNAVGDPGLWYSGSFHQLGAQALGVATVFAIVLVVSYAVFFAIKQTIGLRVTAEEEDAGLDIAETGMYGYPEQFIPPSELIGPGLPATGGAPSRAPAGVTATAMTGEATA